MPSKPTYEAPHNGVHESKALESEHHNRKITLPVHDYLEALNNFLQDTIFTVRMPGRKIEYVNRSFERLFGYSVESVIGNTTEMLYPDTAAYLEFGEKLQHTLDKKKTLLRGEFLLIRKNGEIFTAEITSTFMFDHGELSHIVSIVRDVSDRKRMETALQENMEKYKGVVEDQTEVISRFRPDGTLLFVNEALCRFFNKNEDELIGKKWHPVAHEDDLPQINGQLGNISKDNPVVTIENRVLDGQGRLRWMQFVNRGFFDSSGRLSQIQAVGRDISTIKENERILLDRKKRIKEQAEMLEKTNAALEVLLERRNRQLEDFKETAYRNFSQIVLPDLEKLRKRLKNKTNRKTVSLVIQNTKELLSPDIAQLTSTRYALTKTEIKIATMIRNNMTTGAIAQHLNISANTVAFHRKNVRKKLGIRGSTTRLSAYLQSI